MRAMFHVRQQPGGLPLPDLHSHLAGLPGVTDVVVRDDGRIYLNFTPALYGEQQLIAILDDLGWQVDQEAKQPQGLPRTQPEGLNVPGPGDTQLDPMASSVRDAELAAYSDLDQVETGEANQAKFPGHSTS